MHKEHKDLITFIVCIVHTFVAARCARLHVPEDFCDSFLQDQPTAAYTSRGKYDP
jgi:hypothetical protein